MSYVIDTIYLCRELLLMTFAVITSPFAIIAGLLFLEV
jgi:hypothetical protein